MREAPSRYVIYVVQMLTLRSKMPTSTGEVPSSIWNRETWADRQ